MAFDAAFDQQRRDFGFKIGGSSAAYDAVVKTTNNGHTQNKRKNKREAIVNTFADGDRR